MTNLIKITDLTKDEISKILSDAADLYQQYLETGENTNYFNKKTIAMIFEKPSLRTRLSFEIAANHLGRQRYLSHK